MSDQKESYEWASPDRFGAISFKRGYMFLVLLGILVYAYNLINIYSIHLSDALRLLSQGILWSYFIIGAVIVFITVKKFNSMVMMYSIMWFTTIWTVASASVNTLQLTIDYPTIQIMFMLITVILLYLLWKMSQRKVAITLKNRIYYSSLYTVVGSIVILLILSYLLGYRRDGGVGNEGLFHQLFGEELLGVLLSGYNFSVIGVSAIILPFMRAFLHKDQKLNLSDRFNDYDVSGYVFYQQGYSGNLEGLGYLVKGVSDFPDELSVIEENTVAYRFKRIKATSGIEEEMFVYKNAGEGRGIYTCQFASDNGKVTEVLVVYEEEHGKWIPCDLDEIKVRISRDL